MTKKIIAFAAAMIMVFGTGSNIPNNVWNVNLDITVNAQTYGDWEYWDTESEGIIIYRYNGTATDVTIPYQINGKAVKMLDTNNHGQQDYQGSRRTVFQDTNVQTVRIPASVTYLGQPVFDLSPNLKEIIVDPNNPNYSSSNGILYDKNKTALLRCPEGKSGDIIVPEGVKSIGGGIVEEGGAIQGRYGIDGNSFMGCRNGIGTVTLPESLLCISNQGFFGSDLKRINIPKNLYYIESDAFKFTSSLTNISVSPENAYFELVDKVIYLKQEKYIAPWNKGNKIIYIMNDADTIHLKKQDMFFGGSYRLALTNAFYAGNTNYYTAKYTKSYDDSADRKFDYPLKIKKIILEDTPAGTNSVVESKIINNVLYQKSNIDNTRREPISEYQLAYIPYDLSRVTVEAGTFAADHSVFENRPNLRTVIFADDVIMPHISDNQYDNDTDAEWMSREEKFPLNIRFCCNENSNAASFFRRNNIPYYPIEEQTPGDITGDGNVNMRDLATLQRYINGWDVQVDETTADVNKDGSVNMRDYAHIQRFINGWDVELK